MAMVYNPATGLFEDPESKRRQMLAIQERAQEQQRNKKSFWTDQISTVLGTLGAIGGTMVAPVIGTAGGGAAGAALGELIENKLTGEDWSKNLLKEAALGGILSAGPLRLAKYAKGANVALKAGATGSQAMRAGTGAAATPFMQVFKKGAMPFTDDLARGGAAAATPAARALSGGINEKELKRLVDMKLITPEDAAFARANAGAISGQVNVPRGVVPKTGGATPPTMTQQAGKKLERFGGEMMNTQTNMTRAELRRIGGPDAPALFGHMNQRYGLNRLEDIAEVSRNVTGGQGVTAEGVRNIIGNGKGIDVSDLRGNLDELLTRHGTTLNQGARDNFHKSLTQSIQGMYADQPLNPLANPLAAFDQAQLFRNEARLLTTGATVTGKNRQMANIYNGLADAVEKKLYSQPGIDVALPAVREGMAKTYKQLATQAGANTVQGKAYARLADDVLQIKDIKSLRTFQKPWVQMAKIDEATALAAGNAAARLGTPGGVRRVTGAVIDAATPTAGKYVNRMGAALQGQGGRFNPFAAFAKSRTTAVPGKMSLAVRNYLANAMAAGTPAMGTTLAAGDNLSEEELAALESGAISPEEFFDANSPVGGAAGALDSTSGTPPAFDPFGQFAAAGDGGVFSTANIQQMLENDIRTTGGQNIEDIAKIVAIRDSLYPAAEQPKMNATQMKGMAAVDNAEHIANQIEQDLQGVSTGRVAGPLASLPAKLGFNPNAKTYDDSRGMYVTALARTLSGEVGAMTDRDIARAEGLVPKRSDTPQEIAIKMQKMRAAISAKRQSLSSMGGGFDPFTEMMQMAGGGGGQGGGTTFDPFAYGF